MRFSIAITQFVTEGDFVPATLREYLARAESRGFESAWTQQQVLGSIPNLGPIETLLYAAACADQLHLGCALELA